MVSCKVLLLLACAAWLQDGVQSYWYGSYERDDDDGQSLEDQGRYPCKRYYLENGRFKRSTNCDDDDDDFADFQENPRDARNRKKNQNYQANKLNTIDCGLGAKCRQQCDPSYTYVAGNKLCDPSWSCCFDSCMPEASFNRKHVNGNVQSEKAAISHSNNERGNDVTTRTNTVVAGTPRWKKKINPNGDIWCEMADALPTYQCTHNGQRWDKCTYLGECKAVAVNYGNRQRQGEPFDHLHDVFVVTPPAAPGSG